jgi:hypothetical protein
MPPKRKASAKSSPTLAVAGSDVYVVTLEEINHGNGHEPETKVVGVFNSKAAAVAHVGSIDTMAGTFDSAVQDYEDSHEDNRDNPPDNGVLVQLGHGDEGEGDVTRMWIQKLQITGIPHGYTAANSKKNKKNRKRDASNDDDLGFVPL